MPANNESRPVLHPVETKRASEVIYEQIKSLIVDGQFKPGDRLPSERALMDTLQRSRPTIREALRMLERAGFVRIVPGTNGAIVQEFSLSNVEQPLETMLQTSNVSREELAEFRIHNDTLVARLAAQRRTEKDIQFLTDLLDQAQALIDSGDYAAFIRLDQKFHSSLAITGENRVSQIMTKVLGHLVAPFHLRTLESLSPEDRIANCQRIQASHRQIFDAVVEGNADLAEQIMVEHIERFVNDTTEK